MEEKQKPKNNKKNKKNINSDIAGPIMITALMISLAIIISFVGYDTNINDGILRQDNGTSIIDNYGFVPTLTHFESGVHNGIGFATRVNKTMEGGTSQYALFKSDGKEIHFISRRINIIDLSNQILDFEFLISENVTVINNGIPVEIFQLKRNSNISNTLLAFDNPTGIDLTGSIFLSPFGNRVKTDRKSSIETSLALEYIMKEDTYYLIEFINNGIGDIKVEYDIIWIEEEKQ